MSQTNEFIYYQTIVLDQNSDNKQVFNADFLFGNEYDSNGSLQFTVNLQPPKPDCKKIIIKNFLSSVCASPGYMFQLSGGILRYPILNLDGLNNTNIYEEYIVGQLPMSTTLTLTRMSGSAELPAIMPGDINPYLADPVLTFSIVYLYY